MEHTIHNFVVLVGRILMVPTTVILSAMAVKGLKKILGEVWTEHKQRHTKT